LLRDEALATTPNDMSKDRTVGEYMSETPVWVGPRESLTFARDLVQLHGVRHLPVLHEHKPVGLLSLSDLYVLEASMGVDADEVQVEDVMTKGIELVSKDTPLGRAARQMSDRHIGSVIVTDQDKMVGLFTASDAVRALAELLSS
jgi:acetoin utilization protein AcuB